MTTTSAAPSDARCTGAWVSLVLRLAIAALFFAAAVGKFRHGAAGFTNTAEFFQKAFADTWLPRPLVTAHGYATPIIEALIVLWLLTGVRLKAGWIFTCLFMISLAFGMSVLGKNDVAESNFMYVLICAVGLHFSQFDRWSCDGCCRAQGNGGA
jgi:uncharacterized membrane protein YphA (DoxX/SURF4 family)